MIIREKNSIDSFKCVENRDRIQRKTYISIYHQRDIQPKAM